MDNTFFYILGGVVAFVLIRNLIAAQYVSAKRRKSFEKDYVSIIQSPEYRVKSKHE
jgi:hypothetical protein